MTDEQTPIPRFERRDIETSREVGMVLTPAIAHPWVPHLAVTMCRFGEFEVTHVESGLCISGRSERAGRAVESLVEWGIVTKHCEIDWSSITAEDAPALMNQIGEQIVPEVTGEQTVKSWIEVQRLDFPGGEFPWEEVHPWHLAEQKLQLLRPGEDTEIKEA